MCSRDQLNSTEKYAFLLFFFFILLSGYTRSGKISDKKYRGVKLAKQFHFELFSIYRSRFAVFPFDFIVIKRYFNLMLHDTAA